MSISLLYESEEWSTYALQSRIQEVAIEAMSILDIRFGSLDIIESGSRFSIIDVNAVFNVSEDNTEMFHFDLMKETLIEPGYSIRSNRCDECGNCYTVCSIQAKGE